MLKFNTTVGPLPQKAYRTSQKRLFLQLTGSKGTKAIFIYLPEPMDHGCTHLLLKSGPDNFPAASSNLGGI